MESIYGAMWVVVFILAAYAISAAANFIGVRALRLAKRFILRRREKNGLGAASVEHTDRDKLLLQLTPSDDLFSELASRHEASVFVSVKILDSGRVNQNVRWRGKDGFVCDLLWQAHQEVWEEMGKRKATAAKK